MREGPRVKIVADFADKFSVGRELEQLRGARAVGRTGGVAAREDEDVAFRIDGDAGDFAEMDVRRKFQEIGRRRKWNFGWLLRESRSGHETEQEQRWSVSSDSTS